MISVLFNEEEMANGIIGPIGKKWRTTRSELDNQSPVVKTVPIKFQTCTSDDVM